MRSKLYNEIDDGVIASIHHDQQTLDIKDLETKVKPLEINKDTENEITENGHTHKINIDSASLEKKGLVQLTNELNNKDDINAITPKGVSKALDNKASNGVNNDITELNGLTKNIKQPAMAKTDNETVTLAQLNSAIKNIQISNTGTSQGTILTSEFPGFITFYNGNRSTIPKGYFPADGQILNRSDYPELWNNIDAKVLNVISDKEWTDNPLKRACFTNGDGKTTFRVPDLNGIQVDSVKGLFLRGDGKGDSGTIQKDAIRNITGGINDIYGGINLNGTGAFAGMPTASFTNAAGTMGISRVRTINNSNDPFLFDASRVVPTADENRPSNATFIIIIRYSGINSVENKLSIPRKYSVTNSANWYARGGELISQAIVNSDNGDPIKNISCSMSVVRDSTEYSPSIVFNVSEPDSHYSENYYLEGGGGTIFTWRGRDDALEQLALTDAAKTESSNTFTQPQNILCSTYGGYGLTIRTDVPNPLPPAHGIIRTPAFCSKATNWGSGLNVVLCAEEEYTYESRAVIQLTGWGGGVKYWTFNAGGNAVATEGSWINSSDRRLKEDFKIICENDNILENAKKIRGYTFKRKFKKDDTKRSAGFIAQEVKEILPEAVSLMGTVDGHKEKDLLALDYGSMSAFNHECILKLINRVEKLESKNIELEEKVKKLEIFVKNSNKTSSKTK